MIANIHDFPGGSLVWIRPFLRQNTQLTGLVIENAHAVENMTDDFAQLIRLTTLKFFACTVSAPFIATFVAKVNGRLILPSLRDFDFRPYLPRLHATLLLKVVKLRLTNDAATCPHITMRMDKDPDDLGEDYELVLELRALMKKYPRHCTFLFTPE
ncbi:MAG TPA: hypothetical protein VGO47_05580 [Chlamydiales bacterium]|jgi:hypothetical protein|nr:hypothetical protein [Chlamydiales bacterium]